MIYKSVREEWPYSNDEVWLRWTTDGVNYREEIVHEKSIDRIDCLGIPEWRPLDPPEWMSSAQKEQFDKLHGNWQNKVSQICREEDDRQQERGTWREKPGEFEGISDEANT